MVDRKIKVDAYENNKKCEFHFKPSDIKLKDDAFHSSESSRFTEWWYFDAVFDNSYSLHVDFTTFSKNHKIASSAIEIYNDGKLINKSIKRHLFEDIQVSNQYPFVKLSNHKILEFDKDRYGKKGEWVYNFKNKINQTEIDLIFIGKTKGWKFETDADCWAVPLPKAQVEGEITIDGEKLNVQGIGYHDHNWNSTLSSVIDVFSWYWGKISSKSFTMVFANVMKNTKEGKIGVVINKEGDEYFSINQEKINFKKSNYIRSHGRKIPNNFSFQIEDIVKDTPIIVDVDIEIIDCHFKSVLIAPYWRYHIKSTGHISVGSLREEVNSTTIMEFFRLL